MSRLGCEITAGRVAIQQALFFHFGLSIRQIATVCDVTYSTTYYNVWRGPVIPWTLRKHKDEAIRAASQHLRSRAMGS